MPALVNVQGKNLPFFMLKELKATPWHTFRIEPESDIEYDDEGNPMPPEECFSEEMIEAVERSARDVKEGRVRKFENVEDMFKELNED